MFNTSFMTYIKRYIGHKSLEDQTLSGRNGCLTPSHFVTQPPNLDLQLSRSSLVFILFWTKCNQDPKPCNFQVFQICNFFSINEWNNSIMYLLFFFFFLYKKISGDSTPFSQKERCPKKHSNKSLFFFFFFQRHPILGSLSLSLSLSHTHTHTHIYI